MNMLEERLRKGLAAEADARPLPTKLPQVSTSYSVKGARVAMAAAAVILVVVGGTTLISRAMVPTEQGSEVEAMPLGVSTTSVSSSVPSTTVAVEPVAPATAAITYEGIVAVRQDPVTGDLVGIGDFGIYKSSDNGQSWTQFYGEGETGSQIEALDVSASGQIIAVENLNDIRRDEHGPDSTFNYPPRIHLYDPTTEQWTVTELPRPELPVAGLAPAPMDGSGTCGLGGLQSWVDGVAVAFGEQIAIIGSHRVTGEGICDEEFPFLWTSNDGTEWTIVPDTGTEYYLTGLSWVGDSYVAYGSHRPSYVGASLSDFENVTGSLNILTSTDLSTWTPITIDLAVLPDNVIVNPNPSTSRNSDLHMAGPVPTPDGTLTLVFPAYSMPPRPGTDLADVEELTVWLRENGQVPDSETPENIGEFLNVLGMGINFPLDTEETELLWNFFGGGFSDLEGQLQVERTSDGQWHTTFTEK